MRWCCSIGSSRYSHCLILWLLNIQLFHFGLNNVGANNRCFPRHPLKTWKIIQTWCVSNRLQCPPFALTAEPLQQLYFGLHRSGVEPVTNMFEKTKQTSNLSRFFRAPYLNRLPVPIWNNHHITAKEVGCEWKRIAMEERWMGTGKKHLLRYLLEALVEEMLVHILEQEKQLDL